jgi:hypothetical protein
MLLCIRCAPGTFLKSFEKLTQAFAIKFDVITLVKLAPTFVKAIEQLLPLPQQANAGFKRVVPIAECADRNLLLNKCFAGAG